MKHGNNMHCPMPDMQYSVRTKCPSPGVYTGMKLGTSLISIGLNYGFIVEQIASARNSQHCNLAL